MADVAAALALPVVLVVGLRLGCLNHALLTARALAAHTAGVAGWIGNSIDPVFERVADNIAELERRLQPAAAIVPYASHESEALELPPASALQLMARAASSVT
jgi:dethiobiotin synthetase